jgi:hypothetical protein
VNMIEEPCEGNPQARFCEGERLNIFIRWIGEAELEDEIYIYLSALYSTKIKLRVVARGKLATLKQFPSLPLRST